MGNLNSQFRALELHLAIMADGETRGIPFDNRDRQTLIARSRSEGSSFIYVTLPRLGRAIDEGLVTGTFHCPSGFALRLDTRLPKFLNASISQVFSRDGGLLESPNIESIFYLRQLLLINSKVVKDPTKDQEDAAVRGFADRQAALRQIRLPTDHPVLELARCLLGKVLSRLDLSKITPRHGPGAVHEGLDRDEKWDFTYWPLQANRFYPFLEYGVQSLEHLRTKSNRVIFLNRLTTKICLVPKDFRGPRLISAEMSAMQYLQQGQMRSMMRYIDSERLLRLSIRMSDQTLNQIAARDAYQDGAATLDLSEASDTVSLPLVWFLLSKVPEVRKYLCRTRSSYATFGSTEIRISAFAPMGSAVCFPVETLVFWSLSMATLHLHRYGVKFRNSTSALAELGSHVRVFGDDIVIPEDCLGTLSAVLKLVGCKPNMSKTCFATPFRESCGTEWFRGSPVSITRNKRYIYESHDKLSHFPLLVDLQRRLYVAGLSKSAELVASWAIKIAPTAFAYYPPCDPSTHDSMGDVSFRRTLRERGQNHGDALFFRKEDQSSRYDFILTEFPYCMLSERGFLPRIRLRYNSNLQRMEFRVPVFIQKYRDWGTEGYPRLLARLLSDTSDRVASRDITVRNAWRPVPPGSWSSMIRKLRS